MKDNLSLERMWGMLERVGNPHQKLKVIHVAGTSGKTSTCYYISSLLHASGKKTGLSVSPHVYSITERIQINNKPLSEKKFCNYLEQFDILLADIKDEQSYFEFMITFALWVSVQEKVEYLVLETGLGGLLDSTNVVTRPDKVCVITDIGFDHQHILGNTLEQIATQKAGIIHERNHVLSYEQKPEIMKVIKKQMKLKKATFTSVKEKNGVKYAGLADFQKRNYTLALSTVKYLSSRDNFTAQEINPLDVVIPGRMQSLSLLGRNVLIDGAHNPQKMKAFVESIQTLYPGHAFDIVLAMRRAKDYKKTTKELKPIANIIICSEINASGASPVQSVPAEDLALACKEEQIKHTVVNELKSAIAKAQSTPIIVTGSLYLISELKDVINDSKII